MLTEHPSAVAPANSEERLQVAHVLFMDMVGYSRLQIDLQKSLARELQDIVTTSLEFTRSNEQNTLICRPTGDGMALIFLTDMLAPLRCAVEIASALRTRPRIKIRMGIHSGPLYVVTDINGQQDVHGDGIVMAQRVMDCGDDGHILLSSTLAGMLSTVKPWSLYLTDVGTCAIKHGETIRIYNLVSQEFGNSRFPRKVVAHHTAAMKPIIATPSHTEQLQPPARALTYFALFLLLSIGLTGTAWLVSPAFRDLCQRAYASPASPSTSANTNTSVQQSAALPPSTPLPDTYRMETHARNNEETLKPKPRKYNKSKPKPGGFDLLPPSLSQGSLKATETDGSIQPAATGQEQGNDFDEEQVWHNFRAVARIPRDGRGERLVHVTYKFNSGTNEADSGALNEGDAIVMDSTYQGKKVTIHIEYGKDAVYEHDFASSPAGEIELPGK